MKYTRKTDIPERISFEMYVIMMDYNPSLKDVIPVDLKYILHG